MLPISAQAHTVTPFHEALFTATSAVCVTGLVVRDTASHWSAFGQAVLMVLIQIGGLGITSIGMGLALAAGRRISLRERTLIREAMNVSSLEGMVRLVRAIIKLTLAFELAGVIPIFAVFAQDYPPLKALGLSVFHSISSFNNAGIDILGGGRSLAPYRDNVLLNLSTCFLIISGGIGFLVMVDVVKCRFRFRKFTLHSKVVVTTTAFLLAAGALLLKFTDPLSWLTAFFLSVSARTAGFATLDLGKLSNAGLFTILILMFIGASPGSDRRRHQNHHHFCSGARDSLHFQQAAARCIPPCIACQRHCQGFHHRAAGHAGGMLHHISALHPGTRPAVHQPAV